MGSRSHIFLFFFSFLFSKKKIVLFLIIPRPGLKKTSPFVSKVTGNNFIEFAVSAMLGKPKNGFSSSLELECVGVKAPQFSFSRLKGADPVLSVEMASTGEVACISSNFHDAFLKSIISSGFALPERDILISASGDKNRFELLECIKSLSRKGFRFFATESTHKFLTQNRIRSTMLYKVSEKKQPNIKQFLQKKRLGLCIVISKELSYMELKDEFYIRRKSADLSIPLITNLQLAKVLMKALQNRQEFEIQP